MSKGQTHRSSDVQFNGNALWTHQADFTVANATSRFGHFVAPFDGVIVAAGYNVDVDPSHATNNFSLGTLADIDSIFDEIDITDIGLGYHDLMGSTLGTGGLNVTRGEVYAFGWVGADTDGHLTAFLVIAPR